MRAQLQPHSDNQSQDTSHLEPENEPVRVVYIMGLVRSGSTILDTILGNHEKIESVGELIHLVRKGWSNGEYCACGEPGDKCPFWTKVRKAWQMRTGVEDLEEYISLQRDFIRYRYWPSLLRQKRNPTPRFLLYSSRVRALHQAILEVSGKKIVVDSSKNPTIALALAAMPGIDLRLIHIVRDCRGVAWSRKKHKKKDLKAGFENEITPHKVWKTALRWSALNLVASWVRRRVGEKKAILIRYEDLMRDPEESLKQIFTLVGEDGQAVSDLITQGKPLNVGHTIAGNAMRMQGSVKLRADTEWIHALPPKDQRAVWLVAGWLLKGLGYAKAPNLDIPLEKR